MFTYIENIMLLYGNSCIFEFIKQVGEKRSNARHVKVFILPFCSKIDKLNNADSRNLDSIYHMIPKVLKIRFILC